MVVSMVVIAYNEEKTLQAVLTGIEKQNYSHSDMEVLLVDSASTDGTKKIMQEFARRNAEELGFRRVVLLDNPKKTLPCGWNVALKEYRGEVILKVDAHATIPEDFVTKNVRTLEEGEDICGGQRPNIIDEPTPWKETLLLAESSMFGSSFANYRRGGKGQAQKQYVNSLFHGAYRRKVFDKVGGFDERLARTEDNDIHYRMRKAGFKIRFNPDIISYQHIRSSLKSMLKQKYANGYWIALTTAVQPKALSAFYFVPYAFVLAILVSSIVLTAGGLLGLHGVFMKLVAHLAGIMWILYWCLAIIMAMAAGVANHRKKAYIPLLPVLFFLLHISYGVGTLIGFINLPFESKKFRGQD